MSEQHQEGPSIWPAGFRVRPTVTGEPDSIEVSDVVAGRRYKWSSIALAAAILNASEGSDDAIEQLPRWLSSLAVDRPSGPSAEGWSHWRERSWRPSDQYYIASRNIKYVDDNDQDASVRTNTLGYYLAQDGEPPKESVPPWDVEIDTAHATKLGSKTLGTLLTTRRSGRSYSRQLVLKGVLAGVLNLGLRDVRARRQQIDSSVPISYLNSFGSAWDVYVAVFGVEGVPPGIYRYDILNRVLFRTRSGNFRDETCQILQGQRPPATAAWTIFLVADIPRFQWRYRHEHALRKLYMEAGMLSQEFILVGEAYGLSSLVTPAQRDQATLDLLGLSNERYAPVTTLSMGWSRGAAGAILENT